MRILSVAQAAAYLRELLETDLVLGDVWISGEVSGPRLQPASHAYFVLKDATAQLRSVIFRSTLQRQRRMTDYLTQGSQVIVHGRLTLYEARGELQVVVDFVQPEGVGFRHAQFEKLRLQLEEEGLFDAARKRPLPRFPRRIGVATSQSGAVFHDICNVLRRRWPAAEVVLAPTPVQGQDAAPGIIAAIEALNRLGEVDVIIVARGGGSVEELWAFNEEPVARAVFASVVPVVSAVGHETDFTICDYVADVRAPTPSVAAELVAPDWLQLSEGLRRAAGGAQTALLRLVDRQRSGVSALLARAERGSVDLDRWRMRLDDLERRAAAGIAAPLRGAHDDLQRCGAQLRALDPQATLDRGFAVVHRQGRVVSSVGQVSGGDDLVVRVADGGFTARVEAPGRRSARRNGKGPGRAAPSEEALQPLLFT